MRGFTLTRIDGIRLKAAPVRAVPVAQSV